MAKIYSSEKYEILYAEKNPRTMDLIRKDVACQRTKTWECGDMLEICSFPVWNTQTMKAAADQAMREPRNRREINARQQEKNRRRQFRRIAEANFTEEDMYITLTYAYPQIDYAAIDKEDFKRMQMQFPQDAAEARKHVQAYIRRLRAWMKRNGKDPAALKYIYVTEEGKEQRDGEQLPWVQKFHHHMILSGVDRDTAERIWNEAHEVHGFTNARRLQPNEHGLAQLAAYMTKQKKTLYSHGFAHSKNLIIPKPTTSDRKISRRRVAQIAADVAQHGREILQEIYPGYQCAEPPKVVFSDVVSGTYIYARLRKIRNKAGGDVKCRRRN